MAGRVHELQEAWTPPSANSLCTCPSSVPFTIRSKHSNMNIAICSAFAFWISTLELLDLQRTKLTKRCRYLTEVHDKYELIHVQVKRKRLPTCVSATTLSAAINHNETILEEHVIFTNVPSLIRKTHLSCMDDGQCPEGNLSPHTPVEHLQAYPSYSRQGVLQLNAIHQQVIEMLAQGKVGKHAGQTWHFSCHLA